MGNKGTLVARERSNQQSKSRNSTPVHQSSGGPSALYPQNYMASPMQVHPNVYPNEPPPPYTPSQHQHPPPQYHPQIGSQLAPAYSNSYPTHYPVNNYVPQASYMHQNPTVIIPDAFDAGASVTPGSVIPPPPPGVAPNQAQMAMIRGQKVVLGQKKSSKLTGGPGGGYVFW